MLSPKQKRIILLLLTMFLAGSIFVWIYFINKGLLILHADPQYSVEIKGAPNKECYVNPCEIKIFPGTYQVTFKKKKYFDENYIIEINRLEKKNLELDFREIPTLTSIPNWNPLEIKNIPNNLHSINFFAVRPKNDIYKNFPKDTKKIIFSPNGSYAVIKTKKSNYIYDTAQEKIKLFKDTDFIELEWSKDESKIFYITKSTQDEEQALKMYDNINGQKAVISYFPREMSNAKISISNDLKKIALIDLSENDRGIYIIDTENKWKKRVKIAQNIVNSKWSEDKTKVLIEYKPEKSRTSEIMLFNIETNFLLVLNIVSSLQKTDWLNNRQIVFSTNQKYTKNDPDDRENLFIEMIEKQFMKSSESEIFAQYDLFDNTIKFIYQPKDSDVLKIKRIELDKEKRNIIFRSKDKLYKVPILR